QGDPLYMQSYFELQKAFVQKMGDMSKEFYARFPDHPQAMKLMQKRWDTLAHLGNANQVFDETDKMLAETRESPRRVELLYTRAHVQLVLVTKERGAASATAAIEKFLQASPRDDRGAILLYQLASVTP